MKNILHQSGSNSLQLSSTGVYVSPSLQDGETFFSFLFYLFLFYFFNVRYWLFGSHDVDITCLKAMLFPPYKDAQRNPKKWLHHHQTNFPLMDMQPEVQPPCHEWLWKCGFLQAFLFSLNLQKTKVPASSISLSSADS